MKMVNITENEILKAFNELGVFYDEIYKNLVELGTKKVDRNNDIEIMLNGKRYWAVTDFNLRKWNDCGDFEIQVIFKVKEGSKYNSENIFAIERTI